MTLARGLCHTGPGTGLPHPQIPGPWSRVHTGAGETSVCPCSPRATLGLGPGATGNSFTVGLVPER